MQKSELDSLKEANLPSDQAQKGSSSELNQGRRLTPILRRPSDFKLGKEIGTGSFSTVYSAKEIATGVEYAMKVVDKQHVFRCKAVDSVMMEKEVLKRTNHPFIVRVYYTFQDSFRLYYVLEYARRGELLTYLNRLTSLNVECTKFYSAEILSALNYLHSCSIIHRDLKPENVLLTEDMHIKLADFGSAIILNHLEIKASSFTGTPQYVSPEMLTLINSGNVSEEEYSSEENFDGQTSEEIRSKKEHKSKGCDKKAHLQAITEVSTKWLHNGVPSHALAYLMDYWALGCVIYQMLSGRPPFRSERHGHEYEVFQKVLNLRFEFPDGFDSNAKDLVKSLLVISPIERLGSPINGGHKALLVHPFFAGIDWDTLHKSSPPILVPNLDPLSHDDWDKVPAGFEAGKKYHLACEIGLAASQVTENDRIHLLREQEHNNPYHKFVRGRLILKQGILYKRCGLFARKRLFLLTEGPHLFYVDPEALILKGEVPWSAFLKLELRNSKIFCIHLPSRTYYLEDPTDHAQDWIDKLTQVKAIYFAEPPKSSDRASSISGSSPNSTAALHGPRIASEQP